MQERFYNIVHSHECGERGNQCLACEGGTIAEIKSLQTILNTGQVGQPIVIEIVATTEIQVF